MKKTQGFIMDLDTAIEFYKRCEEVNAETKEERMRIMFDLQAEKRAKFLNEQDLYKELKGKKVLKIKGRTK